MALHSVKQRDRYMLGSKQTVQIQTTLPLKGQLDQELHCLTFLFYILDMLL